MEKKRAVIFLALVLGCVAADIVAPTKSELAALYRKATTEAAAHHYAAALDTLAILDARQPDLAMVENLRGVIYLRQGEEARATKALERALEIDPQFWAARFNLADISFQKKDWEEASKRLENLLQDLPQPARDEMSPLIRYKILLTVVLAKKEAEIGPLLTDLKEWKQSPAFDFGEAAIAFQHGRTAAGKGWVAAAAKEFSAATNKPFLESFYELGWLPRPAGQPIAAADFAAPDDRLVQRPSEATVQRAFEQAQRALQERDFDRALTALADVDQSTAPEPAYSELRAEILLGEKQFGESEAALGKAEAVAPGSWKANFLRARLAFAQGDYRAAQTACEKLLDLAVKNSQPEEIALSRYQLFLSQLLAGKESTAQQTLDQFKFNDPTPAFYFAQTAWSLAHHKGQQAETWIDSADKLFPRESASAYVSPLADLGWLGLSIDGSPIVAAGSGATPAPEHSPISALNPTATPSPAVVAEKTPTPTPSVSPEKAIASRSKSSPPTSPTPVLAKEKRTAPRSAKASATKKHRRKDAPEIVQGKPVASATPPPTPTPEPTPLAAPTPLPTYLDRLARTLSKPFRGGRQKQNQTPPAAPQSPSPAANMATPAGRPPSN